MTWINGEWVDGCGVDPRVVKWCPECDPDANLTQPWEMVYCEPHKPPADGVSDRLVDCSSYLSGTAEAGGSDAIRFANLLHRSEVTT